MERRDRDADGVDPTHLGSRYPAVLVAVCFSVGIGADRLLGTALAQWLLIVAACALGALVAMRSGWRKSATVLLFLAFVGLGGSRHHGKWSTGRATDIARYASAKTSVPIHLAATVTAAPVVVPHREQRIPTPWAKLDRTLCRLECQSIETEAGSQPVSGAVRLQVAGHMLHARVGDVVEVQGWLRAPGGPRNPGEFDFASHLRSRGIRAIIYADEPDAVRVKATVGWSPARSGRITSAVRTRVVAIPERTDGRRRFGDVAG